jgi:hypothetical protein
METGAQFALAISKCSGGDDRGPISPATIHGVPATAPALDYLP